MASLLYREIAALEALEAARPGLEGVGDILEAVVSSVVHLTQADRVSLIVVDVPQRRVLHFLRGGTGWTEVMTTVGFDELTAGLTGWTLQTGEVAISPKGFPDSRESPPVQRRRIETNCGSILVVPLGPSETQTGTITVINRLDQPDFTEADAQTLSVFAQAAAGVLRWHAAREEVARARRDAEVAIQSKTNFLSSLSHELRTPLNGILGFSHLLNATSLDDSQKAMVATVLQSGHRLLDTVDNILELALFEAGQFRLDIHPFSPRAVFESVVAKHRPAATAKGLEWRDSLTGEVPEVAEGDATRLAQAWNHLLSNAVKFTAEGRISVRLGAATRVDGRFELEFEVEDTGIGLPEDRSIGGFSPFHQEDGSLTRRFGGTGLGLALCDRIVRSMGGGLSLQGSPGVGTTVRAWVQLGQSSTPEFATSLGLRILYLDSDPVGHRDLIRSLERAEHRVDVVSGPELARDRLDTAAYEVVLIGDWEADPEDRAGLRGEAIRRGIHLVGVTRSGQSPDAPGDWTAWLELPATEDALRVALGKCLLRRVP